MKKAFTLLLILAMILSLTACKSAEVKAVEDLISNIKTSSPDSSNQIAEAEKAYQALPDEEKGQVSNYGSMQDAKAAIVEDLISNIGAFSLDSADRIANAEAAYNLLSHEEKDKVSNYNTLLDAKAAYNSLGIQLTLDNYEKYINVNFSNKEVGAIDYGEVMGLSKRIDSYVYSGIKNTLTVTGKSKNYDYNDVVVTARISEVYVPFTGEIVRKINKGAATVVALRL